MTMTMTMTVTVTKQKKTCGSGEVSGEEVRNGCRTLTEWRGGGCMDGRSIYNKTVSMTQMPDVDDGFRRVF